MQESPGFLSADHGVRLGSFTGRGIGIAVVDSGLSSDGMRVRHGAGVAFRRDQSSRGIITSSDTSDRIGHGTRCALQIVHVAPDVQVIPVKVFHERLEADPSVVEHAIDWATEQGVHVISMSLATTRRDVIGPWYRACARAASRGVTLVAAASPSSEPSFPAAFDCVFGVRPARTASPFEFLFRAADRYECGAWGRAPSVDAGATEGVGVSSLAAATMAGVIAAIIEGHAPENQQALRALLARCASDTT
ncbi:S8 family serine peptidase [Gemmatimonas aurantiaca]|uniref:S8 family peptidase n=1 Tax=Gemmatimonas aurantiaca TaxID=173480 RepID=UPI00301BD334